MTIITGSPVGCGRSSAHRGRQRPPHGGKRFWYVRAAAALRRGRVSNAVVAATAAALEALSTTRTSSFVRTGADAVRHAIRSAAGNHVAWRVPIHAVELRPGEHRRTHLFTLISASGVALPHPPSVARHVGVKEAPVRHQIELHEVADAPPNPPQYQATTPPPPPPSPSPLPLAEPRVTTYSTTQPRSTPPTRSLQHQNQHQQLNHILHWSLHHRPTTHALYHPN